MDNDSEKPYVSPLPKFASYGIGIDLTEYYRNTLSKEDFEKRQSEIRVKKMIDEAERTANFNELMNKYQKAIETGLNFLFDDIEKLKNLIKENYLDKKYLGSIDYNIERLKQNRKHDFLEPYYEKIDNKIIELKELSITIKKYWDK